MTRAKTARTAIGIVCLAIVTLSLGWFVGHFAPGTPKALADKPAEQTLLGASTIAGIETDYRPGEYVDTSFGETTHLGERTLGKKFATSQETIDSWSDEERSRMTRNPGWEYRTPPLDVTVTSTRLMTPDAFAQWYPHWAETLGNAQTKGQDVTVLLVEAGITNTGTEPGSFAAFSLMGSSLINGDSELYQGFFCDKYLLEELYGAPSDRGLTEHHLPDDWDTLEPGETRTVTLPYLVSRPLLSNPSSYDQLDLSQLCLVAPSYDPPLLYRIWLG